MPFTSRKKLAPLIVVLGKLAASRNCSSVGTRIHALTELAVIQRKARRPPTDQFREAASCRKKCQQSKGPVFLKWASFCVALLVLCISVSAPIKVFAEDEEKKAEGGSEAKPPEGADREWAKRTTKLNVLEAKIKELEKNLGLYIKAKNSGQPMLDEKGNRVDVIPKIGDSYKELVKTYDDYNTAKDELKYRFPEEGMVIDHKYVPLRVRTLEQMEKETGLDGDLTRTKAAIDKKYETFTGGAVKPPPKRTDEPEATLKDTKKAEPSPDQPQRLKLSE